jgi:hypothetical protein
VLALENNNLILQRDELKLQRRTAANTEREQGKESRQNVIMHPVGMAVVLENPQSFSTVHSFEQALACKQRATFLNRLTTFLECIIFTGVFVLGASRAS